MRMDEEECKLMDIQFLKDADANTCNYASQTSHIISARTFETLEIYRLLCIYI